MFEIRVVRSGPDPGQIRYLSSRTRPSGNGTPGHSARAPPARKRVRLELAGRRHACGSNWRAAATRTARTGGPLAASRARTEAPTGDPLAEGADDHQHLPPSRKVLMIDGVNDNGGLQRGHIAGGGGPGAAHPTAADFNASE